MTQRIQSNSLTTPQKERAVINHAYRVHEFGGPDILRLETVPMPQPSPSEVVVAVKAVGLNSLDWKFREGWISDLPIELLPATLGVEFAGVVTEIGSAVSQFRPGDRVMAHLPMLGAYAGYLAVSAETLARIPDELSEVQAAALPISVLTAAQALTAGIPKPGMTVLIHGAAGAVGGFAVQFAKAAGATVIATASTANLDYVAALGADLVIDYRNEHFEEQVSSVDLVLDFVGGDTVQRSWTLLTPGGALVSVVEFDVADRAPKGVRGIWAMGMPDPARLEQAARDVVTGHLRSTTAKVFAADELPAAIEWTRHSHPPGKGVVDFTTGSQPKVAR
jgi:NADPH:quinone reductase-like Zn-dependent oxidoreductase